MCFSYLHVTQIAILLVLMKKKLPICIHSTVCAYDSAFAIVCSANKRSPIRGVERLNV
jgi:hypothetical protein